MPGHRTAPGAEPEQPATLLEAALGIPGLLSDTAALFALVGLAFVCMSRSLRKRQARERERILDAVLEADDRFALQLSQRARAGAPQGDAGHNPKLGREDGYWGDGGRSG